MGDLDPGQLRLAARDLRGEAATSGTDAEMAAKLQDHAAAFDAEADRLADAGAPVDDGRRYFLTGPRGVSRALDNLSETETHTIAVYGSADLARRLAEADELGVAVAFREVDHVADEWEA